MHRFGGIMGIALLSLASGCTSISIGIPPNQGKIKVSGLADGYADLGGIRPYDGTIIQAHLLDDPVCSGEWVGVEVWPLASVGVGLAGARIQVLPLEAGVGTLFYSPVSMPERTARLHPKAKEKDKEAGHEEEDTDRDDD